jgi:hypothetical protein
VAVSGLVFAVLFSVSLILLRTAVSADPADPGDWLGDPDARRWLGWALKLVPLCGIPFLWFLGVVRDHVGAREDKFFATVFLGSGILFVALLFVAGAVAEAVLGTFPTAPHVADPAGSPSPDLSPQPSAAEAAYVLGRRLASALMHTFLPRMVAVFLFVTSSIGLRTAAWPRWISFTGFTFGTTLLLLITESTAVLFLLPAWVVLVSAWILANSGRDSVGRAQ